jgi:hypothetical protein
MGNRSGDYTFELWFYTIMFVVEVLMIHFVLGVAWLPALVLAATVGSLCTWGIQHIPNILD